MSARGYVVKLIELNISDALTLDQVLVVLDHQKGVGTGSVHRRSGFLAGAVNGAVHGTQKLR